jgi:hypothetical protein
MVELRNVRWSLVEMVMKLDEVQIGELMKFARFSFYAVILALTVAGFFKYTGHLYIYLLFSVVSNALLYYGFRRNAIFFDAFIGVFFWLGFWLKFTVRIIFCEGIFHDSVGHFDGSSVAFDNALLTASSGILGLIIASVVREKYIFNYPKISIGYSHKGIIDFYKDYRKYILISFAALFIIVGWTNIYFGIYQRGELTKTILPFGFNGVYKWLLLFGLASVSAVIWQCELHVKNKVSYLVVVLSLFESMVSSVAMFSRGMILNVGALAYGIYKTIKISSITWNVRILVLSFVMFILLFGCSVFMVNYMRSNDVKITSQSETSQSERVSAATNLAVPLFLDRWVGMEGVMAVSSYPNAGWNLWKEAWAEKYSESAMTLYDKDIISASYTNSDMEKKHSISLPGIVAFCFYPASYSFLFGCLFLLGLFAAVIEIAVFKLGGNNLILCSLLAEVVAYRYANFGYVPAQSYLLFGTIFLNLLIINFFDKLYRIWSVRKSSKTVFRK